MWNLLILNHFTKSHLGNTSDISWPRGEEIVTEPKLLLTPGSRIGPTSMYPTWKGLGASETSRAAYEQWQKGEGGISETPPAAG